MEMSTDMFAASGDHVVSTRISINSFRYVFPTGGSLGAPAGLKRYVAFYSSGPWMRPRTGGSVLEDLNEIHGILLETDSHYVVIQAETCDESTSTVFNIANNRINLVSGKGWKRPGPLAAIVRLVEPQNLYNAFGGPEEYFAPLVLRKLGYCTWNSFGLNFTDEDLKHAARSIKSATASEPGYILVDDGWQQVDSERRLLSNTTNERQFPQGLRGAIDELRHTGVESVWIWTAVLGYWNGLSSEFGGVETVEIQRSAMTCLVPAPTSGGVDKYYDEFFAYLSSEGVAGVKVDVMNSLQDVPGGEAVYERYRSAIEISAAKHNLELIYCGGMVPWVLQHRASGPNGPRPGVILRNSDDFFPNVDDSHRWHVYCNFVNSVYTRQFGVTLDFDMFQTTINMAELHAAARIMSGGPVYVTDAPSTTNSALLKSLVVSDNVVPVFRGAPHVSDPLAPFGGFLEVVQHHGPNRLVAIFDLNEDEADLDDWVVATPPKYVSRTTTYTRVKLVTHAKLFVVDNKDVAVFGYVNVMSGIAAVDDVVVSGETVKIKLNVGGGVLGIQWPFANVFAIHGHKQLEAHVDKDLALIKVPSGAVELEISHEPLDLSLRNVLAIS